MSKRLYNKINRENKNCNVSIYRTNQSDDIIIEIRFTKSEMMYLNMNAKNFSLALTGLSEVKASLELRNVIINEGEI